jgi:hypothetical protein
MAQKGSAVQFAVQSHVHVPLGDGIEIEFTSPAHAMACSSSVSLRARACAQTRVPAVAHPRMSARRSTARR